jgi:succinate dehydrogenase / fumarate reductase membrane anchor subunit
MKFKPSSFVTDRARAQGLGAAKTGTHHFLAERISGFVLIPLTFLFVGSLIYLSGASHAEAIARIRNPIVGLTLLAFIIVGAWHMKLGMQVIIEDYVPGEAAKIVTLIVNSMFAALVGLAGVYAIIRITLGS